MAGSRKYFIYTTDGGTDFALQLDESNTEAVNANSQDFLNDATVKFVLPRNIRPRHVVYVGLAGRRAIKCVCLTPTVYQGVIDGGVPTIVDPISGTGNLVLKRANAERIKLPYGEDTGIDDGDAT